jgi:hypothetical protein
VFGPDMAPSRMDCDARCAWDSLGMMPIARHVVYGVDLVRRVRQLVIVDGQVSVMIVGQSRMRTRRRPLLLKD